MTAVFIVSAAALAAVIAAVLTGLWLRARSDRRFEATIERIDDHMTAIVAHLERAVWGRVDAAGGAPLEPTLDLPSVLEHLAREAVRRTTADAAAAQIVGPDDSPTRVFVGDVHDTGALRASLSWADSPSLRAITLDWSGLEGGAQTFRSALVVPIAAGSLTGAVGVFAAAASAFSSLQTETLYALVNEMTPELTNARLLASAEQRARVDELTGVRNRRAYEEELDREVARARRTGRPLSLVVLDVDPSGAGGASGATDDDSGLWEFAAVLTETTRATDVVCRRGGREFALLLPETTATEAGNVLFRVRDQLSTGTFSLGSPKIVAAGLADWQPNETGDSLDTRAQAAARSLQPEAPDREPGAGTTMMRVANSGGRLPCNSRREFVERLAGEIWRAHDHSDRLSVLLVESDGSAPPGHDGGGERVLRRLADRIGERVPGVPTYSRLGKDRLGVALPSMGADETERLFVQLRDALETRGSGRGQRLSVWAGITSLTAADGAESVFGRAEQALWQAKQAGAGTVVVATAND